MPTGPGVYRLLDQKKNILYVGKASNLRRRLRSYLRNNKSDGPWRRALLDAAVDVDVTLAPNEREALILETNLIKELQPKYNVLMKDGKNYLYVRIAMNDPFPRTDLVRRMENDGAEYFGPHLTRETAERTLAMLHELYDFRACRRSLDILNTCPETAFMNAAPCLEYQIGRCCGLCAGMVRREEYRGRMEQVARFLRGEQGEARKLLRDRMTEAAAARKFEKAASLRNTLAALEETPRDGMLVADASDEEGDIFGVALRAGRAHVVIFLRRHGRIVAAGTFVLDGSTDTPAHVLEQFLPQYYGEHRDIPRQILLPMDVEGKGAIAQWLTEQRGSSVRIVAPKRGRRYRLLQLAEKNAMEQARQEAQEREKKQKNTSAALRGLQNALRLPRPPRRIEGYDISHSSGTETVGSMVVLRGGEPQNTHYRSFVIRTVKEGAIDDCAAIREVLTRRLRHLTHKEEEPLRRRQKPDRSFSRTPDLLVIDGGKGQLSVARSVLRDARLAIPVVALAKHKEELFAPGSPKPVPLPKDSPALFLLMRLRDEAHRFANRHREKRIHRHA